MKAIVDQAHATDPRLNDAFREYAQARGFVIDPTRVRHRRDEPRVERCVSYVRANFVAGEQFRDLGGRERAAAWCRDIAGTRVHGTTRQPQKLGEPGHDLVDGGDIGSNGSLQTDWRGRGSPAPRTPLGRSSPWCVAVLGC